MLSGLTYEGTDKARQGKARQGKARQGKARQGKARQEVRTVCDGRVFLHQI